MFIYELGNDRTFMTFLGGWRVIDIKVSWPCVRARNNAAEITVHNKYLRDRFRVPGPIREECLQEIKE